MGTETSITLGRGVGKKHKSHSSTVTILCPMWLQSLYFSSPCMGSESSPYCSLFSRIYKQKIPSTLSLSLPPSLPLSLAFTHTGQIFPPPFHLSWVPAWSWGAHLHCKPHLLITPGSAPTHGKESLSLRGGGEEMKNIWQSNGINISRTV